MKIIYFVGIILLVSLQITCVSFGQKKMYEQTKFERKPFQKSPYKIKQPEVRSYRRTKNGKTIDVNARVVEIDKKTGKYEFRWLGYDGKERVVTYQRHDAIDAIVEASVKKAKDGEFVYKYDLRLLQNSPTHLGTFYVQTFTNDTKPKNVNKKLFIFLRMASVHIFREGVWWDWGFIGNKEDRINGGDSVVFQLASKSPPGIVKSKLTGGNWAIEGADEHMPTMLENEIPFFRALASGYTIGPDDRLSKFTETQKINYLVENLSKFQEAGWMAEGTTKNYKMLLKTKHLKRVCKKAKRDFEKEFISSEVFYIIKGLCGEKFE